LFHPNLIQQHKNKEQGFHTKTQNQKQNILQNILPQIVMIIKLEIERHSNKKKHNHIFSYQSTLCTSMDILSNRESRKQTHHFFSSKTKTHKEKNDFLNVGVIF